MRAWFLAVAVTLAVPACSSTPTADPEPAPPITATTAACPAGAVRDQRYATDARLQSLDVYLPDRGPGCPAIPIVVFVHGGAFSIGDKANNIDDKVSAFNEAGWAFASVNYRLADEARLDPDPSQLADIEAALTWLVAHASEFGLDETRIALVGHSAGAYLTALVATDPKSSTALRAAVALDTGRFALVDEIAPSTPPLLLFTRGSPTRMSANAAFADAIAAAGGEATVVDAEPYRHEEVNDAVGRAGDTIVTPPLMAFLAERFDDD